MRTAKGYPSCVFTISNHIEVTSASYERDSITVSCKTDEAIECPHTGQ